MISGYVRSLSHENTITITRVPRITMIKTKNSNNKEKIGNSYDFRLYKASIPIDLLLKGICGVFIVVIE